MIAPALEPEQRTAIQLELRSPQRLPRGGPTLCRLVPGFLDYCLVVRNLSPRTIDVYDADLLDFRRFAGDLPIGGADRDVIHGYVRSLFDRELAVATIRRRVSALRGFFTWTEEQGHAPNPFHRIRLRLQPPRLLPRSLTAVETRQLLDAARVSVEREGGHRLDTALMHFVVVALFTTGIRLGEILAVQRDDVDAHTGAIKVFGKGSRERYVYMVGPEALGVLRAYLTRRRKVRTPNESLLVTEDGGSFNAAMLRRRLRTLGRRARIHRRLTPHMLRHTAATQLLEAGVDIRLVQRLLGHASIASTEVYTHVSDRFLRDVLARTNTLRRIGRTPLAAQTELSLHVGGAR
jgi:integrase/recombinase XerD